MRASIKELRAFLRDEPDSRDDLLGRLTRARSVSPSGGWSAEEPTGRERAWHEAWSEQGHDYGIVYGHWAMQGLHVAKGLRGLDTGCVHHGRGRAGALTGWIPDRRASIPSICPTTASGRSPRAAPTTRTATRAREDSIADRTTARRA